MASILYFLLFLSSGCAAVRFLLPEKRPLVRFWLGLCLGTLLLMWLPDLFAYAFGFTLRAHIAAGFALLLLVGGAYLLRGKRPAAAFDGKEKKLLLCILAVSLPLTVLSCYLQLTHMILPKGDGSLWCGQSTYGDLCMHLAFTTSLENAKFPPAYTLLYGTELSYPYLTDSLSSTFHMLGLPLNLSLVIPGTFLMFLCYLGFMLLAARHLGDRRKAVAAAALLFFLNGGLGFLYDFDLAFRDGFAKVRDIFTGYYHTPANQPELNLRFSNVICDLMIPQRSLLGGWAMVMPCLWLLPDALRHGSRRETVLLGLWAGALPLVHTHTFLALGLFSGGYVLGRLILKPGKRKETLCLSVLYLGIVLVLALPQLLSHAVKQTLEGGALRFQFNWVNNSGGRGFIDGYFWFWIKNAGLPFVLFLIALPDLFRRGRGELFFGMTAIFAVAELFIFQPNEYDNNKLFYIWYLYVCILAADAGGVVMQRLAGLRGRAVLAAFFLFGSVFSGCLSIGREAVSSYQLFSANACRAADWILKNTEKDSVFLTGQQHVNPVASLAGRQIICGSDLYVFFHGLHYAEEQAACRLFYEDPDGCRDVLRRYGVDYIYVSDYERSDFDVDTETIGENWPLVYENRDVRIYDARSEGPAAGEREPS